MIYAFFQRAIMVKGTNSSTFVSYGASWSFLERLSIAGLEYWGVRFILARIVSAYFSSRSVTVSFYSASFRLMLHLFIRQCFQRNVEVKALVGRSVLILVICLWNILITCFFLYATLVALSFPLLLLISSSNLISPSPFKVLWTLFRYKLLKK